MPDPTKFLVVNSIESQVTVGPGSAIVLAENVRRVDADISIDSANVVYLARGNAAVMGMGPRLNPNGGSYHIGTDNLFTGDIYGIADDESNLAVSEGSAKP
ncbi:hypothetical protein KKF61_07150 [Patescibacteria group bacterium]|nr:hypothetical protein [Patescibacteria group bacterium]